jgi:hypothetical protein
MLTWMQENVADEALCTEAAVLFSLMMRKALKLLALYTSERWLTELS